MANNKISVAIKRKGTENGAGVLRRFSRKFRETGITQKVRDGRYHERLLSPLKVKNQALRRITRYKESQRLLKLGKVKPTK